MLFNEFAHSLHEYVKPKIGVVPYINNLMRNCLPITLYAKIANTTAYRYYNKGISSIYAKEIYNCIQCDKLKEYIEKATQAITNKEEIVDTFKGEIADLSIDNYPERLAKLFETIIIKAAESENNEQLKQNTQEVEGTEQDIPEIVEEAAEQITHEGIEETEQAIHEGIEESEQVTPEEEAKQLSGSGVKTGSVKLLEPDRIEIAGIIKRLIKIIDRIFAISITADLCQQNHSTELVEFLSNASKEQFETYNESHVLQFHMCDYDTWKANRTKSKPSESKAIENKDIPNTAKEEEDDDLIDQVFGCSGKVINENTPEWLKEIGQNLEELMSENQKLSLFCTLYPQYDALTKLYQKAFTLRPKMFCRDWASDIEKPYSKDVNEYIELLKSCFQSIV